MTWLAVARARREMAVVRAEFIAAVVAEQDHTGGLAEICAVLNRLPRELLTGPDHQVIDEVDALMDDLYRDGELVCPGHRWLSGPRPVSIRGCLVRLHADGNVGHDVATAAWWWAELTSFFSMPAKRSGRIAAPGDDRLFRCRREPADSGSG